MAVKKRVVIVDDSKFLVKQIGQFFEQQMSFEVVATGNDGNDAIELYRKYRPDLITLDITMPNRDGLDALKTILAEFSDANILMISAVRGDAMLECMSAGAKGYVEKPLRFSDAEFVEDFKESVGDVFSI